MYTPVNPTFIQKKGGRVVAGVYLIFLFLSKTYIMGTR